jgi:AcrR family transcriptional regulator
MSSEATRKALLDAADQLFANEGYSATSLRQLTARAGTNLAAVHYHFGSKEALAKALLARTTGPINDERSRRLAGLEARPTAPEPREVLLAFLEPALRNRAAPGLSRVFGRILAEQPPFLRGFLREQFGRLGARFVVMLGRAAPHLTARELWWRLHFTVGAMAHTLQQAAELEHLSGGLCDPRDVDTILAQLVAFASGGLTEAVAMEPRR